jgi:hypothetical protein
VPFIFLTNTPSTPFHEVLQTYRLFGEKLGAGGEGLSRIIPQGRLEVAALHFRAAELAKDDVASHAWRNHSKQAATRRLDSACRFCFAETVVVHHGGVFGYCWHPLCGLSGAVWDNGEEIETWTVRWAWPS